MQTSQSVFVFFPSHRMRFEIGNNQPVEKQLIRRDLSLVNLWSISGLLFVYFPDMNYIYSTYFHCISFLWSPQVVIGMRGLTQFHLKIQKQLFLKLTLIFQTVSGCVGAH